jgi:hypothetical protein
MFGKPFIKNKNYLILAVRKNEVLYCGSYTKNQNYEYITSLDTGEIFHSLKEFVVNVIGFHSKNEYKECLYYNDTKKRWRSVKYILKKTY